jgi:hypothetical protein
MERKKSEIVARMAQYHLIAVCTLAAFTVAPNIWKLLNSRCQQHCCSHLVIAGTRICIQIKYDLLIKRQLKLCSSPSGLPKRLKTCNPCLYSESLPMPAVGCTYKYTEDAHVQILHPQ